MLVYVQGTYLLPLAMLKFKINTRNYSRKLLSSDFHLSYFGLISVIKILMKLSFLVRCWPF